MYGCTKQIETERLVLRKFKLSDAPAIFKNYACSETVTKYLTWSAYSSKSDAVQYLKSIVLPAYKEKYCYRWAITLKGSDEVIGCIDVVSKNINKKRAELGWVLGESFWGKGIMPEAGVAVIKFLFSEGFVRIEAKHDIENAKSGRAMEKMGMSFEGTLKKYELRKDGSLVDCKIYAIVSDDNLH